MVVLLVRDAIILPAQFLFSRTLFNVYALQMKICVMFVMIVLHVPLEYIGTFFLSPLESHPRVQLMVTMLAIPLLLNATQYWVRENSSVFFFIELVRFIVRSGSG
jgi:hypothetical protein